MKPAARKRASLLATVLAICLAFVTLSGCRTQDQIDAAIGAINGATASIQGESADWRNELPQLQGQLQSFAANAQAQGTLDAEKVLAASVNDVQYLTADTLKVAGLTLEEQTARFGTEARCNVDFAKSRVSASLHDLANRLQFWKAHGHTLPAPPPHSVCQVTPDNVELFDGGSGWVITSPSDKLVGVYGYDFRADALPTVELDDAAGHKVRDARVAVSYVTRYQINLNFGGETFDNIEPGFRYVLQWPDEPEPNAVSIVLSKPSHFKIVNVAMPTVVRARVNQVQPTVTVINDGGADTGQFVIAWIPQPGALPLSTPVPAPGLKPDQQEQFLLQAYTYPNAGSFDSNVNVASAATDDQTITVTPYANTPQIQQIPIGGEWPHGGGEPGDTKSFPDPAGNVQLGTGCVLDQTRGGGSFTNGNPNHPGVVYTVAWPSGYDFGFGADTIWSSINSVHASYDPQANRVSESVTLRGLGGHGIVATRGPERFNGTFTVYSMCPGP